jgi:hypothetical protein
MLQLGAMMGKTGIARVEPPFYTQIFDTGAYLMRYCANDMLDASMDHVYDERVEGIRKQTSFDAQLAADDWQLKDRREGYSHRRLVKIDDLLRQRFKPMTIVVVIEG